MYVHRSNRTERLVDALVDVVGVRRPDPFSGECIVVQGRGMERWLSMELARRFGVWANPHFPFPRAFMDEMLTAVLGQPADGAAVFEPETMLWAIAALLPRVATQPAFAPIRGYLADDPRGTKRLQLAERIANTFDHYAVYRPRMILDWEAGADESWQAVLWRALAQRRNGGIHAAARVQAMLAVIERGGAPVGPLPPRVSLFGVSTLPPLYVEALAALSRLVEVHLFVLSPSNQYWVHVRGQREQLRELNRRAVDSADREAALHLEEGHPLLASLGRLGRDFQGILEAADDYVEPDADLFDDPGAGCMLATLQSDILALRVRGYDPEAAPRLPLDPDDASIVVHSCHGPMREAEVLHDQLRALFEADPTLQPRDVVVMTPSIDTYAPYIDAVFRRDPADPRAIPYRLADRCAGATDAVADAFGRLLAVLRGRMTATEVFDLVGLEPIRARFGIEAVDLDRIRAWIAETGIRWGVDGAHRAAVGQPELAENTWRFGLDRLLLGCAMAGEGARVFGGVLPYDDMEGAGTELLGRFVECCDTLFRFRAALQAPRPPADWGVDLSALLDAMMTGEGPSAASMAEIRGALTAMAERAAAAGFAEPVELETVRAQVERHFARPSAARGFLSGGVSVCELVPMRAIPFRVVCLVGMNDDAFPRTRRPLGFDLIAQRPRPGDRSARDDDRYLFLEALLSARERLLITYTGQSVRDNTSLPPSVVVSELLDTIEASFATPDTAQAEETPRSRLVVRHPLQAFSPEYFHAGGDPRLFSYEEYSFRGARAVAGPRRPAPPFLLRPIAATTDTPLVVTIDELVRFFRHPVRAFVRNRLGLDLGDSDETLADREPMDLYGLGRWQLGEWLLRRALDGADVDDALAVTRAAGELPLGVPGACAFAELAAQVKRLRAAAEPWLTGERCAPVRVGGAIDGTPLAGVIRDLWPAGQVVCGFGRIGGKDELGPWIRHIVLNWAAPDRPRETILIGQPAKGKGAVTVRFRPPGDAASILRDLVELYRIGQRGPLTFFATASRTYVEALARGTTDPASAASQALKAFEGAWDNRGDADNYTAQVFGNHDPIAPEFRMFVDMHDDWPSFAEVARRVLQPLLAHRSEVE